VSDSGLKVGSGEVLVEFSVEVVKVEEVSVNTQKIERIG
jgi:hypothetical protein